MCTLDLAVILLISFCSMPHLGLPASSHACTGKSEATRHSVAHCGCFQEKGVQWLLDKYVSPQASASSGRMSRHTPRTKHELSGVS